VMEPGVVGLWRPVLLVPSGIEDDLTSRQLAAVLTHELCHIRRRDNVTAAVHMIAEAVFWFHPLVWWIGSRLVDERERACDEEVVRTLGEPQTYAEGIVSVCKRYVESPLACVSGVSGSNVKNRIRDIMTNRAVAKLGVAKKAVLAAVGTVAVIAPILAQSVPVSSAIESRFEVTSVKFNKSEALPFSLGVKGRTYTATNAPLRYLVAAAYGVPVGRVLGGPPWVGTASIDMRSVGGERFDILAKLPEGTTPRQAPAMLRVLLAERFSLAAHPEVRDASIYALVLNRSDGRFGPRLKKADVDCDAKPTEPADAVTGGAVPPPSLGERCASEIGGAILGRGQRLSTLARMLSFFTERPVIDRTGLTGGFDFDVQSAELATPTSGGAAADSGAAGMFTAVEEQLGLKLESTRGPLEFVVIDTVDHPKEN
jgi:bla regulator protein BlaR1